MSFVHLFKPMEWTIPRANPNVTMSEAKRNNAHRTQLRIIEDFL